MPIIPTFDGQVTKYAAKPSYPDLPRIYFVNGIQTDGSGHAAAATELSKITERAVYGVYNSTAGIGAIGMIVDLLQCRDDWIGSVSSQLTEWGVQNMNKIVGNVQNKIQNILGINSAGSTAKQVNVAQEFRNQIPEENRIFFIDKYLELTNRATASMFYQLRRYQGQAQHIIAHSQGNLVTCNAVWAMVMAYGERSLSHVRVYSLASPAPAWPEGLNYQRRVYGHTNDIVTFARPQNWPIAEKVAGGQFGRSEGDWRQYGDTNKPGLGGHDLRLNIFGTSFANDIRREVGLAPV
ncbi:MAG: hypothetical protein JW829_11090 [Pirellulales bacterium]|nr:hypothetical protein [Pirellulales bacterium]